MAERNLLYLINEKDRIAPTGYTGWSDQQTLTVASDPTVPSAPTLAAAAADQAIDLTITAPTTNTDGTTIVDILEYNIYYDTTDAIDVTNPGTYAGIITLAATRKTYPGSAKLYFKATCMDKWGNESSGSNEVNATPTVASGVPVSVDDYADNFASIIAGKGMIGIIFNVPKATWERWAGWKLYSGNDGGLGAGSLPADPVTLIYTGSGGSFIHKGLNESYLYEYKLCILGEDQTITAGTIDDNTGSGYQANVATVGLFDGTVLAQDVVAVNEVRGDHFYAQSYLAINNATWQQDGIQLQYNAGNPRAYVGNGASEYIMFDGTYLTWNTANTVMDSGGNLTVNAKISILNDTFGNAGVQFDYNGGTPKMYIGDGSNAFLKFDTKITWKAANSELDGDGKLTVTSATLTSGTIGDWKISTHLYTGTKTAYNDANAGVHVGTDGIGFGNNIFTVSAAGAVVATNIQCTNLTVGAGSSWAGNAIDGDSYLSCTNLASINANLGAITAGSLNINGVFTVSAAGAVVASSISCTNLSIGAGSSYTGNAINGDSYVTCTNLASINANLGTITAGSISSAAFRTATSGARAVIDTAATPFGGTAHTLKIYDANRERTKIGAAEIVMTDSDGDIGISMSAATYGYMQINQAGGPTSPVFIVDAAYTSYACYIKQNVVGGAVPVLTLVQDDISEGFINFSGSDRGVITGATNSTGSVRVEINNVVVRLATFADA